MNFEPITHTKDIELDRAPNLRHIITLLLQITNQEKDLTLKGPLAFQMKSA